MTSKTFEILYKPYSKEVLGYFVRIADYIYIVINNSLSASEADKVEKKLRKLVVSHPPSRLVILKGDGEIYKTDNLDFLERAC